MAHYQPGKYWPILCRALGLARLADDPRFCDIKSREENSVELVSILDDAFASKTREEWLKRFASEDLVYAAIKDYWEVINDPQVLENDFITEFDHPSLGKLKEIGIPVKLNKMPGRVREAAPQLGQNTEEVLIDILGYSWEEIEKIRDEGIIL